MVRINDTFCECLKENPLKVKNNTTNNKAINRLVKKKLVLEKPNEETSNKKSEETSNKKSEEISNKKSVEISKKSEEVLSLSLSFKLDCGITITIPITISQKGNHSNITSKKENNPETISQKGNISDNTSQNGNNLIESGFYRYEMKLKLIGEKEVEFLVERPGVCFSLNGGTVVKFFL
jgi:hypothetical protein